MMEALTLRGLQETDMIKPEDGKSAIGALGDWEKNFFGGGGSALIRFGLGGRGEEAGGCRF